MSTHAQAMPAARRSTLEGVIDWITTVDHKKIGIMYVLMALVFLAGQPDKAPMTVRIPYLLSTYGQEYNLLSAASFLLMIVPLIVFFSLQRYFVQGLLAGSVKT